MGVLIQRLGRLLLVALVVSFFSFLLLDLVPGDPVAALLGLNATEEAQAAAREELGLDQPFAQRYVNWVADATTGDLGRSYVNQQPTWNLVRTALPKTVEILILAQLLALAMAFPAAVYSARRPGSLLDRVVSGLSFGFVALPSFILGVYLVSVVAVRWGLFPPIASDIPGLNDDPLENLHQMFLPSFTLALPLVAVYLRLLRSDLITTLQEDYVLLARARGLSERRVLWRHALRPSSLNLLTAVGLNTGGLIGGALIIEQLFAVPGMGRLLVQSIFLEDYPVVQGLVLVFCLAYVGANFLIDLLYAVVDPRIRHGRA